MNDSGPKDDLSFVLNSIAGNDIFKKQIHFLPNWNPKFAEMLFPAVNIWLNTPRPLEEACGTSGIKAALNGALNVSTKAGFWPELPDASYFKIEGEEENEINTEAELASFYLNITEAITSVEYSSLYFENVKKQWKGGILEIASGARMVSNYLEMALPKPLPEQV